MEIGKFFTPGRITVALVVICLVVIACAVWPDPIWNFFMKTQGGAIGLGLLSGIVSGLISAWVYGFRQKEVWQKDVKDLYQKTLGIDSVLSGQLKQLRDDYDMLLKDIAPAIGGSFTQSLFEYHPMASKEIARILSEQTKLQYERHHSRVIVQTAEDKYTVKGLKRINSIVVWSLEFHIAWTWYNDSKITKEPLDDFLLVADTNAEALESLFAALSSTKQRDDAYKKRTAFLGKNIARSIIVSPSSPESALPVGLFDEVYSVDKVWVGGNEIDKSRLDSKPKSDLPIGVYAAWSLPKADQGFNPQLPVGDSLIVEYSGHLCLAAQFDGDNTYSGYMTYPPSDVISEKYNLKMSFPPGLTFDDKLVTLELVDKSSGCRFIHGPLKNQPKACLNGYHDAEMVVPGPLTDLHQISLTWEGKLK
jgi:hypothetical protein